MHIDLTDKTHIGNVRMIKDIIYTLYALVLHIINYSFISSPIKCCITKSDSINSSQKTVRNHITDQLT